MAMGFKSEAEMAKRKRKINGKLSSSASLLARKGKKHEKKAEEDVSTGTENMLATKRPWCVRECVSYRNFPDQIAKGRI